MSDFRLRVLTWNLWWRCATWENRSVAIERTLQAEDADIVFLQEVWGEPDGPNQAQQIAETLGFSHAYTAATVTDGIELGNAILSRWPLTDVEVLDLPHTDPVYGGRRVICATVSAPFGPVLATTTHLAWQRNRSADRQQQVRTILEMIDRRSHFEWPPIFGGDFNADPDSDEIGMIVGRNAMAHKQLVFQDAWANGGDYSSGFTWTPESKHFDDSRSREVIAMPWIRRRVDYLFVGLPDGRPSPTVAVQVEDCRIVGKGDCMDDEGSDHYAVVADLRPHRLE